MSNKSQNKFYIRILTALIKVDENGNEEAEPACIDVPIFASTKDEALQKMSQALAELVRPTSNPVDINKILQEMVPKEPANHPFVGFPRSYPVSPPAPLPQKRQDNIQDKEYWTLLKKRGLI